MSDNFVLLNLEKYHTNCHLVRHKRKTKHQAYQETNAVERPGQTYKIGYPSLHEDRNELEITGELSLAHSGFIGEGFCLGKES